MKNLNKQTILVLGLIFIFLAGCQGIKDNLSLKKKDNNDEFLVQKKNPLVLPPDYKSLPKPIKNKKTVKQEEKQIIKKKQNQPLCARLSAMMLNSMIVSPSFFRISRRPGSGFAMTIILLQSQLSGMAPYRAHI